MALPTKRLDINGVFQDVLIDSGIQDVPAVSFIKNLRQK